MASEKAKKTEKAELDISELTYEQAYQNIEETVSRMTEPSVPLEELMRLYEQAMLLGAHCEKLLKGFEARMERVSAETIRQELAGIEEEDDEPPFEVDEDDEF